MTLIVRRKMRHFTCSLEIVLSWALISFEPSRDILGDAEKSRLCNLLEIRKQEYGAESKQQQITEVASIASRSLRRGSPSNMYFNLSSESMNLRSKLYKYSISWAIQNSRINRHCVSVSAAGLDPQCPHTKNVFASKPKGLWQIRDYVWKVLGKENSYLL